MIPPVDKGSDRHSGVLVAFWIACGLAIAGGLAPLAFGGTSNRIAGVIIPFGVAALAFALNALIHSRGRVVPTLLYFVAGIGIVYGILWMITVPLQLAVVGTCPAPPETCQPGQLPSLTSGEANGLTAGVGLGLLAIAFGFIGLAMLYRRRTTPAVAPVATPPMARSRPPMTAKASVDETEAAPVATPAPAAAAAAETEAVAEPSHTVAPADGPEAPPELPAPEEPLELPAPEPELELPAHEATTEPEPAPPPEPTPAPADKPKVRRPRKPRPTPPAGEGSEPPPSS